jgi:adenosylmethionine-8-amino-7-oxononanoate aminotransferase
MKLNSNRGVMTLSQRDTRVIWHPYTQMKTARSPVAIVRGEGAVLFDEEGKTYIDAISSWWVNIHGHSHPYIAAKVSEQLRKLEHVIFAGFTHEPAVELAERLLKVLPGNQSRIFYSDNGSTAVEVGIKMALQYWYNKGVNRKIIITLNNSYHGDTFGAMSVSVRDLFTRPFWELLFEVVRINAPIEGKEEQSVQQLRELVDREDIAAFIFEPLLQGAGGMIMYSPKPLDKLVAICKEADIPTIADEVLTGFGRTGKMFASDYLENKPDIVCLSKGITGGTMAFGATSCTEKIYDGFYSDDKRKAFFHGHSYTGNPLACVAALANLDLFDRSETWESIERIKDRHKTFESTIKNHPRVRNTRRIGTVAAFDVVTKEKNGYLNNLRDWMETYSITNGVIIRPLGNTVYLMPPYCITDEQLEKTYSTMYAMLDTLDKVDEPK